MCELITLVLNKIPIDGKGKANHLVIHTSLLAVLPLVSAMLKVEYPIQFSSVGTIRAGGISFSEAFIPYEKFNHQGFGITAYQPLFVGAVVPDRAVKFIPILRCFLTSNVHLT